MKTDLHTQKAAEIFCVPPEQVTREQRRYAKTVNYIQAYSNAGPLRAAMPLSRAQAAQVHQQFTKQGGSSNEREKEGLQRLDRRAQR